MRKEILIFFIIGLLAIQVNAIKVGVVIRYPGGTEFTKCVSVSEGTDGYEVLQETGLDIDWLYFDSSLGHGLCGIESIGCPSSNCWCGGDSYWGFMIKGYGESDWTYSPVGFDGGDSCWNGELTSWDGHYCAESGDLLAVAYGTYGTQPSSYDFDDICGEADMDGDGYVELSEVIDMIDLWSNGIVELSDIVDAIFDWENS